MSTKAVIKKKVQALAEEAAGVAGVEIADLELLGQIGRLIVRVTIDRDDGIGIKDCERMSRQLEALLDIEDPIPGGYTLEVTSPGLDRPLKSLKDYERFRGRLARVVTRKMFNKNNVITGRILDVRDEIILFQTDRGELEVPYSEIKKGRLEVEMP